ncbi:MAG: helix-turn-helix domain-containing protein [Prolixibacteraceae bacterium]|jgi:hypothetical protein|nr:helix-turn-helix domain-containing protein [Prolixibacteraceae bacterium]
MNFDRELINRQLRKIVESRHFNKSKISCDLLEYLVSATLDEKSPKEFTIGIELFGKRYGEETKPDANIRVYIHNLRKKLNDYYRNEGSRDPLIFEIEKGKYNVRFISRKDSKPKKQRTFFYPFLITLLLLGGTLYWHVSTEKKELNPWRNLPVWQDFADDDKKTLLVLGDYFVFSGLLPTGNIGIYRDFSINSEVEYEHLLDKKPELIRSLTRSPLTYLSKMSAFCQNDIQKVFAKTGTEITVKLSSDIQPVDLKEYNIIFIGNYKNMGLFENIVRELHFSFGISSGASQYIFPADPCAEVYAPENTSMKQTDYSLVIYTKGYNNNRYLFFLCTQDIGNISTVGQMTNLAFMSEFRDSQLKLLQQDYFKALFKVEGINKTDLSFELLKVE